ncbi:MAG: hypothetical protein SCJ97_10330 [Bacillota bacterium]|nr:hypothetical protein [Bacillota bacterium]
MARNSVKIGIVMLIGWVIPLVGLILACIGLSMGISSYRLERSSMAKSGIFLNGLGLILAVLNIAVSIYLLRSGVFNSQLLMETFN